MLQSLWPFQTSSMCRTESKYFLNFSLIYLTPFYFEQNISIIFLFSDLLESFILRNYFKLGCNRGFNDVPAIVHILFVLDTVFVQQQMGIIILLFHGVQMRHRKVTW